MYSGDWWREMVGHQERVPDPMYKLVRYKDYSTLTVKINADVTVEEQPQSTPNIVYSPSNEEFKINQIIKAWKRHCGNKNQLDKHIRGVIIEFKVSNGRLPNISDLKIIYDWEIGHKCDN
jgi:hypothetical protein